MKNLFLIATLCSLLVISYSCASSDATDEATTTDKNQEVSVENDTGSVESIPPGEFVRVSDMKNARIQHAAILIEGGKVLVMGGKGLGEKTSHNTYIFDTAEIYDPSTDTWEFTGVMAIHRYAFASGLLPEGRVIVAGGRGTLTHAYPDAEIWDSATGEWMMSGEMEVGRYEFGATILSDGRVIVAGGNSAAGVSGSGMTATTEVFTP